MRYIALTIGPIVDTLSLGRKTSEIWMASYLFSSFMKKVIARLKESGDAEFLVPYTEDASVFEEKDDGIGMFHDRFILKTESLKLDDIKMILDAEKKALANMVASSIKHDAKRVEAFMDDYFQTYLLESEKEYENPILDISSMLDAIELHTPHLDADEDYMRLFLNRDIVLNSPLAKTSFGKKPSFDSIESIAAQEIDSDKTPKNAQAYIAIVHADGDNLGSYIKAQTDAGNISKRLFDFDKSAAGTIKEFGALPLFIGGDDLLFFAPVVNDKQETLFDLLDKLSKEYEEALQTTESTLSFGVSITYYKYPLYEALEKSRNALFTKAKQYEGKNAVAVSAQKHSGQSFEFCLSKNEPAYEKFTELAKTILGKGLELPHAVHHKVYKHGSLFENIDIARLGSTFENLFNEDIHQSKFKEGLEEVQALFATLGNDAAAQTKLFAMLSAIKLIRGDR